MKKNLRNILALSLGLMTTVAFAQDWNVDSRTRIDMSDANGDGNKVKTTDQRVTLGATWGGSDWGIHVSSDVNYTLGADTEKSMRIYEAYASADLMGYASVTAGRQALNYGSGALLSSNDWAAERTTWEGMTFGLNLDAADVTIGYHSQNGGAEGEEDAGNMWINAGGEFSGWNVNVLYMQDEGMEDNATGIDISGDLAGASVSASMNQDFNGGDMTMLGATYSVNDDMNVVGSYTTYGEEGFYMPGTNMDGSWMTTGGVGYLGANDENMSLGLTYNMGSINLGATMHQITNSENDDYERDVMEISLGYSLGDNAGLSLKYATDATGDADEDKYMWLTLNVGL
ncbi:MAG: porin [Flavobacteriales bacterium]|nr:porin [Flavobacteriales bacterium]